MAGSYLTQEEVDRLPEGTEIIVTWTGGNGPHRYTIWIDNDGTRLGGSEYALMLSEPLSSARNRPLTFVGKERWNTKVSLDKKERIEQLAAQPEEAGG